ncbi:hypothetical protein FEM48_Zijuj03G0037300 [Ziziphus jujuba var. spinosa]|uniref:ABC transporter B family member 11-like n=1 Tax=Ziziphus jujuba var. spinosa TaxID=714518 RepID=A0A978VMZ3_ZIZJJ|nr:hypothetical protein FEM48_Zijuj03G0037300 [Ziziphus jujuba var. spinosa]
MAEEKFMGGGVDSEKEPENTSNQQDPSKRLKQESTNSVPYYKLFSFADSWDYLLIFAGTIGAVGNGMSLPLGTIIFGTLVNSFGELSNIKEVVHEVSKVSLQLVYLALGSSVASFLQVACWMVTGERQAAEIRSVYLKTILRQEVGFFDKQAKAGEIVERMSGDTVLIQDAMGEKVGKFLQLAATFLGGFIVAFAKGWLLTLVMLSSIPVLSISSVMMSKAISKMTTNRQSAVSEAATVVEQTIGSIRTVASFTGEKQAIDKCNKLLTKAYKSGIQESLAAGLGFGVAMFILFCCYGFAVWFGGKMIIEKGYSGGDVASIVIAILTASMSLGQASPCISSFAAAKAAAFKMFETINRKPEIDAYNKNGQQLDDICGDIELRDVHFSYPARPNELILDQFLFPYLVAGEILIDGVNLKEFQLKWIRQKIGLVSQEPALFTCSIRDNIAYGKDGATAEEIRAAAELANAANFIDKLPQGADTMVGEHGTQLSGGQKQRVAIARAILRDPRILLLDEATSSLDAESERVVQEALDRVMINRTTVIVAHRLITVRNADIIAVIHHGKIIEEGSHSELVKDPHGAYSQLIRLQEINTKSDQVAFNDQDSPEIIVDTNPNFSIIQGSSGIGNSGPRSFPVNALETAPEKTNTSVSTPSQVPQEVSLFRLALLNKPEFPILLLGSILAAISGMILPAYGVLLSAALKTFFEPAHKLNRDSKFWALIFVGLGIVCLAIYPSYSYLFGMAGCKLIRRIRSMCFEKVVYMEISWFDEAEHSSGAIAARLSVDAAFIRGLVGDTLALLVQNVATVTAGLVIAFEASWQVALIILVMVPLLGLNVYAQFKFMKGYREDAKKMFEEATQVVKDAIGSIRTVASFCAEKKMMKLYRKKCQGPIKKGLNQGLINGVGLGLSILLFYSVYACSFYAGAQLVADGKTDFSNVFRAFFALTMMAVGVSLSSSLAPDTSKAKTAVASIFAILDRKSKIDSSDDSGTTMESVMGDIEFFHVSFNYPTRPDVQIFRDLCLAIHSGKTVALVGESGTGKSTVISLLQRFYEPNSGHITLDGIEIQKLKLKWFRQQMGLVSQEPVLFNDTIRANIAYGNEGDAKEAEILAAAELANAHYFISSLEQGYNTIVGERGIQLSGGQKQRVAIARAIMKAPKILLLDEATSSLDAESERLVQDALDQVMVNRTTVVVAHRLSTIKGADLIAVVKNGVIAEKGKHQSLINIKDGIYASLAALHANPSS